MPSQDIRVHYYELLDKHFNDLELHELCFELGVDYDDLPGTGKKGKAMELVGYLDRRNLLPELAKAGRNKRPQVCWDYSTPGPQPLSPVVFQGSLFDPLRKRLSDRLISDDHLYKQFQQVRKESGQVAKLVPVPSLGKDWVEYTESLDQIAHLLVPPNYWSMEDIFILCCAIYLHKIGLVPDNAHRLSEVFEKYPLRSKKYIEKFGSALGLDQNHIFDVAWVCYGHRKFIDDNNLQMASANSELARQTQKGRKTRAEIAAYLRILSRLGAMGTSLSMASELYFAETCTSDYKEMRMNAVVSGFKIDTTDIENSKILLRVALPVCERLVEDLRFLREACDIFSVELDECAAVSGFSGGSFFHAPTVRLDVDSLQSEIEKHFGAEQFLKLVKNAIEKSLRTLLACRINREDQTVKGWCAVVFEPPRRRETSGTRVANTAEVFLAFTGWPKISTPLSEDIKSQIKVAIDEAIASFKWARVKSLPARREQLNRRLEEYKQSLEQAQTDADKTILEHRISILEEEIKLEEKYDPLTSLTYKVPTVRVNSLAVIAFTQLLAKLSNCMSEQTRDDVLNMMKDSILWLCKTSTGPFDESTVRDLSDEFIFQLILSIKALINSQPYWKELDLEAELQGFQQKVSIFVHTFMDKHRRNRAWPKLPFKAMALEIFVYCYSICDSSLKQQVGRLIEDIVDELLKEIDLENFSLWSDVVEILRDEEMAQIRDWTHATTAWVMEGLCKSAHLLTKEQKRRFLQTVPLVLLKQDPDGFYESTRQSPDLNIVQKPIYKIALYTYALTQVCELLENEQRRD